MSDIDVWPAKTTAEQIGAGIADLQHRIDALISRLADQARGFHGDGDRARLDLLVALIGELQSLNPGALTHLLPTYMPPADRQVGEQTLAWMTNQVPSMRRNSGSWGAR